MMYLSCQLCDTVYCGDDINTGLASVWRKNDVTSLSEGYGTYGLCIFIHEGILYGCKERLECICVCNILCL